MTYRCTECETKIESSIKKVVITCPICGWEEVYPEEPMLSDIVDEQLKEAKLSQEEKPII